MRQRDRHPDRWPLPLREIDPRPRGRSDQRRGTATGSPRYRWWSPPAAPSPTPIRGTAGHRQARAWSPSCCRTRATGRFPNGIEAPPCPPPGGWWCCAPGWCRSHWHAEYSGPNPADRTAQSGKEPDRRIADGSGCSRSPARHAPPPLAFPRDCHRSPNRPCCHRQRPNGLRHTAQSPEKTLPSTPRFS